MDKQKIKNQKYYNGNKTKIAEKLYKKETCECCGDIVSHQNIKKHKRSTLCRKRTEKKKEIDDLIALKNKFTEMESTIDKLLLLQVPIIQ